LCYKEKAPAATGAEENCLTGTKHNRKRRRLSRADINALADASRKWAATATDPELDPEWRRIKEEYSLPEIIDAVKAQEQKRGKGRPISKKTLSWIARIRAEKQAERGYLRLAKEFRPDLPLEQARAALRVFRSRWAKQIDS
jgi:hypothetical protein